MLYLTKITALWDLTVTLTLLSETACKSREVEPCPALVPGYFIFVVPAECFSEDPSASGAVQRETGDTVDL